MNDPSPPLDAAQRIHQSCEQFEDAWGGPTRPQLGAFLADVHEPERSWLLAELLALEVELRQAAGDQPTEAEYLQAFPGEGDRDIIAAAFRRCADLEREATPAHPAAPRIEGYDILDVLGRGGMGVVYKARDLRLKRLVALKMIRAGDRAGAEHLARFRAEAEMVARLQHPNIVQIFEVGEQDGQPYLAFEFIEGKTLADFAGREPQPPRVAAELLEALARAMNYAHQQGVIHRDLKPTNVVLAVGGGRWEVGRKEEDSISPSSLPTAHRPLPTVKITDFGLAKDLAGDLERTSTGAILGTPLYMSPEQADGRRDIGPASDIYSLGAILYVLLTGRPPFQGTTPLSTLKMVVNADPVPPCHMLPHLARDLETICLKCLHKDPARRYATAGALADDLRRYLNNEPILARPSGRIEKGWRWCRRNPAVAMLLASVLVVLVAGVVVSSHFAYTAGREAEDAKEAKARADASAQRARERAYGSDIRLVQRAWDDNLLVQFLDLLDRQRPERTDNVDVRGFEWHYWRRQADAVGLFAHHSAPVTGVCFSPDGTRLASCSIDGMVKVRDAGTGREQLTLKGHTLPVRSVCFSPDGKQIASSGEDGTVRVWDAGTGQEKVTFKGPSGGVVSAGFSPDGTRIVSGSGDATVRVWDARPSAKAPAFEGHKSQVTCLDISPNGRWLASSGGNWTGAGYSAGELRLWDRRTGALLHDLKGHTSGVTCVGFSPDGRYLASGSGVWDDAKKGFTGVEFRLWEPSSGAALNRLDGHASTVLCVAFSPDSQLLASADFAGGVLVRRLPEGRDAFTLPGLSKSVTTLAFSPDGRFLAGGGFDQVVKVWDLSERSEVATLSSPSTPSSVAFSPDGKLLAVAAYNSYPHLYDTTTYKDVRQLRGHLQSVTHIVYSPDGKRIATTSEDKTVRLWDSATGQEMLTLKGHTDIVRCVKFSPDGHRLYSGGWDRTIRVWDATPRD